MPRPSQRSTAFLFLAALLLATLLLAVRLAGDPQAAFLRSRGDAEWIRLPTPPDPHHHPTRSRVTRFRTQLALGAPPSEALLEVLALRRFELRVNGTRMGGSDEGDTPWVHSRTFDVAPNLRAGSNVLRVDVGNAKGPPAVRVHATSLGVHSGEGWEARESHAPGVHGEWAPVALARDRRGFAFAEAFPTSAASVAASAPLLLACFAAGFCASWLLAGARRLTWPGRPLDAVHLRGLLLVGFAALCAHNLLRLPLHVGMDALSHYNYVLFLAEQGKLPLASDGAQMFQPPLFYLLALPPYLVLSRLFDPETVRMGLRGVSMLAGLALVEVGYRSAVALFPTRRDLRLVATLVAGLLPVSVYMAQSVGNEPLAGCLTALVVLGAFRLLHDPPEAGATGRCATLGVLLGVAALAKVTVLLLTPALVLALIWSCSGRPRASARAARGLVALGLSALAVAGWYFARNWVELGVPYVGGWNPNLLVDVQRDLGWQDPGYGVPSDLLRFGDSLVRPLYASIFGFWDGLYSTLWLDGYLSGAALPEAAPPWNYPLMLSLALLSLPLTAAILWGAVRALTASGDGGAVPAARFAVLCLASYLAAMLYLHLSVPTYSNVKASYTMGLAPCYALLAAWGLEGVLRGRLSRALVGGYLTSWAACVFGAFWG